MQVKIDYKGISTVPSDYDCNDGELAMSLNAISERGDIRPLKRGTVKFSLAATDTVLFLHTIANSAHYIIRRSAVTAGVTTHSLFYRTATDATLHEITIDSAEIGNVSEVTSIGNTLVLVREDAPIAYMLWKGSTDGYLYLGDHIPEMDIRFGLLGHPKSYVRKEEKAYQLTWDKSSNSEVEHRNLANALKAACNSFVKTYSVDEGRFCFPFFVRFALRLYDGTLVNHSAPVLMTPSTKMCPAVIRLYSNNSPITYAGVSTEEQNKWLVDLFMVAAELQYQYMSGIDSSWSDIVKSVEIFVTPPIYTYNVDGDTADEDTADEAGDKLMETRFVGKLDPLDGGNSQVSVTGTPYSNYCSWSFYDVYGMTLDDARYVWWGNDPGALFYNAPLHHPCITLPELSSERKEGLFTDAYNYYLIKSIELSQLSSSMASLNLDGDILSTLVNRERMTDDYRTHEKFQAGTAYAYNSRLNIGNIEHSIFPGFGLSQMVCKCEKIAECSYGLVGSTKTQNVLLDITDILPVPTDTAAYVKYEESAETKILKTDCGADSNITFMAMVSTSHWPLFLYYPSVNGKELTLRVNNDTIHKNMVIPLRKHPFLNGSYASVPFGTSWPAFVTGSEPVYDNDGQDVYYSLPNRLFTSEVNNPFVFPARGMNAIGDGSILKLSSAAKAMSTGQFGQYPMYAFTTEGVWALEVSSDGTFKARQPFTRDVSFAESILQLDSSVVFLTSKGLVSLSGSDIGRLSDSIEDDLFDISKLGGLTGSSGLLSQRYSMTLPSFQSWRDFIDNDCRMLYDYVNERIYLYKAGIGYSYVLSLKSGNWAISTVDISKGINSYPDCLCEIGSDVVNMSENSDDNYGASLIITRPIGMGDKTVLKTVRDIVQIGTVKKTVNGSTVTDKVSQLVYGSRDMENWELISSSVDRNIRNIAGTPYLYFRMVVLLDSTVGTGEGLSGAQVDVIPRK